MTECRGSSTNPISSTSATKAPIIPVTNYPPTIPATSHSTWLPTQDTTKFVSSPSVTKPNSDAVSDSAKTDTSSHQEPVNVYQTAFFIAIAVIVMMGTYIFYTCVRQTECWTNLVNSKYNKYIWLHVYLWSTELCFLWLGIICK